MRACVMCKERIANACILSGYYEPNVCTTVVASFWHIAHMRVSETTHPTSIYSQSIDFPFADSCSAERVSVIGAHTLGG
jgi:hypothetical protein